jgi:hypothetical protein
MLRYLITDKFDKFLCERAGWLSDGNNVCPRNFRGNRLRVESDDSDIFHLWM